MSRLHPDDAHLHHCDGSHRWAGGPPGVSLEAWQASVRAHMQEHLATMGGPAAKPGQLCAMPVRRMNRRVEQPQRRSA